MDILPGALWNGRAAVPTSILPLTVNTVITLDEFTPVNGATRIVPGSKDEGGEIDSQRGKETAVLAACPAGSLIAWSGSTVSFPYACCWHMCVPTAMMELCKRL